MSELLTLIEAAKRLRVSKSTVERLIRAGRLRSTKVGGRRVFVTEAEIERYLAAATRRRGVG